MLSKYVKERKAILGKLPDRTTSLGYTVIYTTDFGRHVCDECAKEIEDDQYETLEGYTSYEEGPSIECDECGEMMESDYGEVK